MTNLMSPVENLEMLCLQPVLCKTTRNKQFLMGLHDNRCIDFKGNIGQ